MYLDIKVRRNLVIDDPDDLIESIDADVLWTVEDPGESDLWEQVVAARFSGVRVPLDRIASYRESLHDVFDARSADMQALYTFLFEGTSSDVKESISDDVVNQVVYLEHVVIHPALRKLRCFLVDHICEYFEYSTLIVIWDTLNHATIDIADDELSDLGFRLIPESKILVRSNAVRTEYRAHEENSSLLDVTVPASAPEYVQRMWDQIFEQPSD